MLADPRESEDKSQQRKAKEEIGGILVEYLTALGDRQKPLSTRPVAAATPVMRSSHSDNTGFSFSNFFSSLSSDSSRRSSSPASSSSSGRVQRSVSSPILGSNSEELQRVNTLRQCVLVLIPKLNRDDVDDLICSLEILIEKMNSDRPSIKTKRQLAAQKSLLSSPEASDVSSVGSDFPGFTPSSIAIGISPSATMKPGISSRDGRTSKTKQSPLTLDELLERHGGDPRLLGRVGAAKRMQALLKRAKQRSGEVKGAPSEEDNDERDESLAHSGASGGEVSRDDEKKAPGTDSSPEKSAAAIALNPDAALDALLHIPVGHPASSAPFPSKTSTRSPAPATTMFASSSSSSMPSRSKMPDGVILARCSWLYGVNTLFLPDYTGVRELLLRPASYGPRIRGVYSRKPTLYRLNIASTIIAALNQALQALQENVPRPEGGLPDPLFINDDTERKNAKAKIDIFKAKATAALPQDFGKNLKQIFIDSLADYFADISDSDTVSQQAFLEHFANDVQQALVTVYMEHGATTPEASQQHIIATVFEEAVELVRAREQNSRLGGLPASIEGEQQKDATDPCADVVNEFPGNSSEDDSLLSSTAGSSFSP